MEGSDRFDGDDRTFDASFTADGAAMLRERVLEKLKEFMGDYTDDTLVEYVLVLLRNGRHKNEARRELHVFLGNDSFSFVNWLWDHLSSNIHLYIDSKPSLCNDVDRMKSMSNNLSGGQSSHSIYASGHIEADSDYRRESSEKFPRIHRNRDCKGFMHDVEPFPNQGTTTEIVHLKEKPHHRLSIVRRSPSPKRQIGRKRARQDEPPTKREAAVHSVGASRRLLQFAVRDAVKTVQQPSSRAEPAPKRLRSVVSASTADIALDKKTQRSRPAGRAIPALTTVIKAAVESAENVSKNRYSASVFDRLGRDEVGMESRKLMDHREDAMEVDEDDGECNQMQKSDQVTYYQRKEYQENLAGNVKILNRDVEMVAVDSASDNYGYDEDAVSVSHNYFKSPKTLTSAKKEKDSLTSQYNVVQNADNTGKKIRPVDQNSPANGTTNSSSKIVNISVNVNTWKPSYFQKFTNAPRVENQTVIGVNEGAVVSNVALKENNNSAWEKEREKSCANVQKEPQKAVTSISGSYTTARPLEDLNSRTVYVSNVHFATTKDNLSRHFNKFGEVLKVVIVTDATTGQPTGSAYVEFLRKESAELSLSLNGTSFMSRILKVVLKSSGHHVAAPMIGWPRSLRGSTFASRFCGVPYGRGLLPNTFRARLQLKTGARSLQWKRDVSTVKTIGVIAHQDASASFRSGLRGVGGRNLTYVRPESKADGSAARV